MSTPKNTFKIGHKYDAVQLIPPKELAAGNKPKLYVDATYTGWEVGKGNIIWHNFTHPGGVVSFEDGYTNVDKETLLETKWKSIIIVEQKS